MSRLFVLFWDLILAGHNDPSPSIAAQSINSEAPKLNSEGRQAPSEGVGQREEQGSVCPAKIKSQTKQKRSKHRAPRPSTGTAYLFNNMIIGASGRLLRAKLTNCEIRVSYVGMRVQFLQSIFKI